MVSVVQITTAPQTIQRFLTPLIVELKKSGVEVTAISSDEGWGTLSKISSVLGVGFRRVTLTRKISPISDAVALFQIVYHLSKLKPDIVHCHTPKAGLIGVLAARLVRTKFVCYTVRGLPFQTQVGVVKFLLQTSERIACGLAHEVICVSESVRSSLLDCGIGNGRKMTVSGSFGSAQGVDSDERFNRSLMSDKAIEKKKNELGISEEYCLGFIGRLTPDKGVQDLVDIWRGIGKQGVRLIIIGADNDERNNGVREALKPLLEDSRVLFTGVVEDVELYYALLDIVVFPSHREGFPNVILEASAMEVPTIGWDVVGVRDAIEHGSTGTLVPKGDISEMVREIEEFRQNPQRREEYGKAARARVMRHYQPGQRIAEVVGLYKSVGCI